MSMSKKDFVALADALRRTQPRASNGTERAEALAFQWAQDVNALAQFCRSQNPRFDEARWRAYLGRE